MFWLWASLGGLACALLMLLALMIINQVLIQKLREQVEQLEQEVRGDHGNDRGRGERREIPARSRPTLAQ